MPIVSSICSMRGMPSVVTESTCVFAPLEQAGAVRGWDDADLGGERADVGRRAAVDADALVDDALSHHLLLEGPERLADLAGPVG